MSDFEHIWAFDFETDPFKFNRIPKPFCVGIQRGPDNYVSHWGNDRDVIDFAVETLRAAPPRTVAYAHNGGKFDFHFFKEQIEGEIKVISARIAECNIGATKLRDSFSLLPVPLSAHGKTEIDYNKMEADVREEHREEILAYLEDDCKNLLEFVTRFADLFGTPLTMAGAAMKELKKFHEVERITSSCTDEMFRKYYYGGRVECLQKGVIKGDFKVYDVNSMYPSVMKDLQHPISAEYVHYFGKSARAILERCDFATIKARNNGALPRVVNEGTAKAHLSFTEREGIFHATGHEIRAGLETGRLQIIEVIEAYKSKDHGNFAEFIDYFYGMRMRAADMGDDTLKLFYKLVMNSAYGKFAQNPEGFKDWVIVDSEALPHPWLPEHEFDNGWIIYSRPTTKPLATFRHNIMTAASITGGARAMLLKGLHASVNPLYCDTDSVICESLDGDLDEKRLGAWKEEARGNKVAIAGKKLYAIFDGNKIVKHACKGVRITPADILRVAQGEEITYQNQAPTFNLTKNTRFIERRVRAT